ncbi:uncharacterized protein ALTATR162_LOCUS6646 [Alternaria atra]|uniref:BZIP domain-containing protein n=1 Tax=Alternaria atra TaxID=119953 RepID=A0A8J2N723_9PLEO|nr:uncharacterized protein ALTATR162_LOCUS6646 [Alternaria atra]CAG5164389.1 unnamed protein product [Alternaria atra]
MVTSPATSSSDHTSDTAAPRSRRSRVSAEHTLNRVRENQRRHRARQRDHVASLEQKLAETEKLLSDARAEIVALKEAAAASTNSQRQGQPANDEQVEKTARGARYLEGENTGMQQVPCPAPSSQQNSLALTVQPGGSIDPQLAYPDVHIPDLSFLGDSPFYLPLNTSLATSLLTIPSQDLAIISSNNTTAGPPPCCSDPPNSSSLPLPNSPNDLECSSCKTKPPPDPSESTTLCAQAFVMIGQQNFRNLDPDTIRLWLAQGLRRAQKEGEGCRVENGALMRLLDFISGL